MKFIVSITRIGYCKKDFTVEASSPDEARGKAYDKACNDAFKTEYNSDYKIGVPIPIDEEDLKEMEKP